MVTDNQNLVIDKASKIIDILNLHLDEIPKCEHSLKEILDERWVTTWNDYLGRIKYFFRLMHNYDKKQELDEVQFSAHINEV